MVKKNAGTIANFKVVETTNCFHKRLTALNSNLPPNTINANGVAKLARLFIVLGTNVKSLFKNALTFPPRLSIPIKMKHVDNPQNTPIINGLCTIFFNQKDIKKTKSESLIKDPKSVKYIKCK